MSPVLERDGRKWKTLPLTCKGCGEVFHCPTKRAKSDRDYCTRGCANRHSPGHRAYHDRLKERATYAWRRGRHRFLVEQRLGRKLEEDETVHHIDGDCLNDAAENLQVRHQNHGRGHVCECQDCGSRNVRSVPL